MSTKVASNIVLVYFFILNVSAFGEKGVSEYESSKFIDEIKRTQEQYYNKTVSYYDSLLARKSDPVIHIEKCRFMDLALYDPENEENPKYEDWQKCYESLLEKHGDNLRVQIYSLEQSYGEEADSIVKEILVKIEDNYHDLYRRELSDVYVQIAEHYYYEGEYKKAITYAKKALKYNDSADVRLLIPRCHKKLGQPELVKKSIVSINGKFFPWEYAEAADLLVDMNYNLLASEYYRIALKDTSVYVNYSNVASAFELTGEIDAARTYHQRAVEKMYNKDNALRKLFEFDLRHSDGDLTYQSYRQYRDNGFLNDPFSVYRLKLLFKSPRQPIVLSDFIGVGLFFIFLIVAIVIPYLWILPFHYSGCFFVRKSGSDSSSFSLKDLWVVNTVFLFTSLIATVFFDYERVLGYFNGSNIEISQVSQIDRALYILVFSILLFVSTMAVIIRSKRMDILKPSKLNKELFLLLSGSIIVIVIVRKLNLLIFPEITKRSLESIMSGTITLYLKSLITTFGGFITWILVGIIIPVYEEIIFRGIALNSIKKYLPFWICNCIQAVVFALIHDELMLFPFYFTFGVLLGIITKKTNSVFYPIILHGINNTVAIATLTLLIKRFVIR